MNQVDSVACIRRYDRFSTSINLMPPVRYFLRFLLFFLGSKDSLMASSSSSSINKIRRSNWTRADSSSPSDKLSCFLLPLLDREVDDLENDPKEGKPFLTATVFELSCMVVNNNRSQGQNGGWAGSWVHFGIPKRLRVNIFVLVFVKIVRHVNKTSNINSTKCSCNQFLFLFLYTP